MEHCQENFLSHRRMRDWREIYSQLHGLVSELGLRPTRFLPVTDEIHRALLAGLLGNIGFKSEEGDQYLGARGIKFSIFPGSVLKKAKPKWDPWQQRLDRDHQLYWTLCGKKSSRNGWKK